MWFGFVWLDRQFGQTDKINGLLFAVVEFGLVCLIEFCFVWFAYSTDKRRNQIIILINLICEFVFGYSIDKQTN